MIDSSLSPQEVQKRLQALEKAREERPWRYYTPIPKNRDGFHKSLAKWRLVTGPNGGGKSWAGGFEAISYATGYNHLRDEHYPTPNRGWVVARDMLNQGPLLRRIIQQMAPRGTRWVEKAQKFVLPQPWKSEIYMKTTESGVGAFTAERIMWAWFDEERESDQGLEIFKQTMRRTQPGWPLRIFMTVTPIEGYTWSYDYLWDVNSKLRFPGTEAFNFTIYDSSIKNGGFLTEEEVQEAVSKCRNSRDYQTTCLGQYANTQGEPAFDTNQIMDAIKRSIAPKQGTIQVGTEAVSFRPTEDGEFFMLVPPVAGREYIMAADPGMGVYRDYSINTVWDRLAPIECAFFRSNKLEPARFARQAIAPMGRLYNNALSVVESNSEAGGAVLANLPQHYGHIYMQQDFVARERKFKRNYGFRTDTHSRGLIFDTLKDLLPRPGFIASEDLLREAMHMIVDDKNRIDHLKGKHDDHVVAAGIALAVARMNPAPQYEPWSRYREEYRAVAGSDWG